MSHTNREMFREMRNTSYEFRWQAHPRLYQLDSSILKCSISPKSEGERMGEANGKLQWENSENSE